MKSSLALLCLSAALAWATPVRQAAPQCSYVPRQPGKPNELCGVYGSLSKPRPAGSPVSAQSVSDCRALCNKAVPCQSIGYTDSTNQCQLYQKVLGQQGYQAAQSGSTILFDRHCLVKQCDVSPPATCSNQGIQWAVYPNNQGGNSDNTYSTFDPTAFKTQTPEESSVTYSIGGIDYDTTARQISVYGDSYMFDDSSFVLNHQGYIFATTTGAYTFSISASDDITEIWVGSDAYSGWTRSNEFLDVPYSYPNNAPGSSSNTYQLTAGTYTPFRVIYANAQGGVAFDMSITDPKGNVLVDANSASSDVILQYSCDGTTAPAFEAFGSQT